MKQGMSQSCAAYMSQLRFVLPECKYKHDSDDLLKVQFIFGLFNKEIQDHLLGELSETDNSVKALYKARKIESKLEQRKLLGIVTPRTIGMDTIKSGKNRSSHEKCDYCGQHHKKGKQNCLAFGKICNKYGQKNHFKAMCRSSEGSRKCRSDRTKKCTYRCNVHEMNQECQDDTGMEDLADQVQSLFYH